MTMTDKVTPKSMEDQYKHQLETFKRKNHDYGNSFEKSLDTFGLVAGIVRMNDKFERLLSLTRGDKDALVGSESLVDTLEDLSNYAAMAACWLKGKKAEDWEGVRLKELDGNIESIIKNADAIVDNMKGESKDNLHINSAGGTSSVDIKTGKIEFIPCRGNGKSASFQQAIKESLDATKNKAGSIMIKPEQVKVRNLVPKSEEDIEIDKISERIDAILEDIRKKTGGKFDKKIVRSSPFIHKPNRDISIDLEPYLEEMCKRREKEVREKPLSELMAEHTAAQKKAMDDLDMMLDAMANGQLVSRVVDNGDGSFVAYWEKAGEEDESGEE